MPDMGESGGGLMGQEVHRFNTRTDYGRGLLADLVHDLMRHDFIRFSIELSPGPDQRYDVVVITVYNAYDEPHPAPGTPSTHPEGPP